MKEDKKKAKKQALQEYMKKMMSEDMKGMDSEYGDKMQKVTVAAPSEEGLEEGLSMAEKILKKKKMMEEEGDEYMDGGMKYMDGGMGRSKDKKDKEKKKTLAEIINWGGKYRKK